MKKVLIFILVSVGLVGLLLILLFGGHHKTKLVVNEPFARNIRYPHVISNHEFYFFSGSGFVKYDLANHATSALTPVYLLPNVTEVKWGSAGALFQANNYTAADQLFGVLKSMGLPTANHAYWWVANFKNRAIELVKGQSAGQISDLVWQQDSPSYLTLETSLDNASQTLSRFDLDGQGALVGKIVNTASLVWANTTHLLVVSHATPDKSQLVNYDLAHFKPTQIADNLVGPVSASVDGSGVLFMTNLAGLGEGTTIFGNLTFYASGANSTQVIQKNFAGEFAWSFDGNSWVAVDPSLASSYVGKSNGSTSKLTFGFSFKARPSELKLGAVFSEDHMVVTDGANTAYEVSAKRLPTQPTLPNPTALQQAKYTTNFYTVYDPKRDVYLIYILRNPYHANLKRALSYVRSLGLDPYQLNIIWLPDVGVNRQS